MIVVVLLLFTGLFTLILASIFQSSTSDKFSVTKLLAVIMRLLVCVIGLHKTQSENNWFEKILTTPKMEQGYMF